MSEGFLGTRVESLTTSKIHGCVFPFVVCTIVFPTLEEQRRAVAFAHRQLGCSMGKLLSGAFCHRETEADDASTSDVVASWLPNGLVRESTIQ